MSYQFYVMTGKRKLEDITSPELMDDTVKKASAKSYPRRRTAVAVRSSLNIVYITECIYSVKFVE